MNTRTATKLGLLGALYFSQGLPFGFFTQALPVFLRKQGLSLTSLSLVSLLTLPWALKFLWAPLVDRWGSAHRSHHKRWIVPLQLSAAGLMFAMSWLDPKVHLGWLFAGVLMANVLAATQDIATDGLAVQTLDASERGLGNGLQVAGYRVGMIVGGGALLVIYDTMQWAGTFALLGVMLIVATLPILGHTSKPAPPAPEGAPQGTLGALVQAFRQPNMKAWIAVLVAFKLGDAMGAGMLRPMLVDLGLDLGQIGWLLGAAGFSSGLVGAVVGGALVNRVGRKQALIGFGALQVLGAALYILPTLDASAHLPTLYAVCLVEHFTGGMATAALFTLMMDRSRPEQASTDYTLQASVVVIVSGVGVALSGPLAQAMGYTAHFTLSAVIAAVGILVVALMFHRHDLLTHTGAHQRGAPQG